MWFLFVASGWCCVSRFGQSRSYRVIGGATCCFFLKNVINGEKYKLIRPIGPLGGIVFQNLFKVKQGCYFKCSSDNSN